MNFVIKSSFYACLMSNVSIKWEWKMFEHVESDKCLFVITKLFNGLFKLQVFRVTRNLRSLLTWLRCGQP